MLCDIIGDDLYFVLRPGCSGLVNPIDIIICQVLSRLDPQLTSYLLFAFFVVLLAVLCTAARIEAQG